MFPQRALSGVLENKVYQFVANAKQLLACITGVHGAHRARHAKEDKEKSKSTLTYEKVIDIWERNGPVAVSRG